MPPRTRAGSRINKFRLGYGRQSDNKVAWLRTDATNQLALIEVTPEDLQEAREDTILEDEAGNSYILVIPVPGRQRPLHWNLTGMTSKELEATRQFFEHTFNLVDPIIRERDRLADHAFETTGDDSFTRLYRAIPQFVTRQRKKREHRQGVHDGPSDATEGSGGEQPLAGGVRDGGDELADSDSQRREAEDDGPQANVS